MTEAESQKIERGRRAALAFDEFVKPELDHVRAFYRDRIVEVAAKEFHPGERADKLTSLSIALKVVESIETGLRVAIIEGEKAQGELLKVETIAGMSNARRRALGV